MCRDEHGQPAARYEDSGRNPVGGDIVYHYATSPSDTDPLPAHRPLTHPRTRSRTSSPPPQSCKRLLRKGCLRLIYNTKHVFVFFITENQKNPAGTLSFRETSIFKHEIKHASLCVHVRKFE